MNVEHTISRRAMTGYLGAALVTTAGVKWAVPWGTAAEAELCEIPLDAFVGVLPESGSTGTLMAILLDPGPVGMTGLRAYLCNGEGMSEWFDADIAGDEFSLTAESGAVLEGTIGPAGISGTIWFLDRLSRAFELRPATGAEGLYHLASTSEGLVFGAAEGGSGVSYRSNGDRIDGAFVLPGGIVEPIDLPAESAALDAEVEDQAEPASYRAIVVGSGSSLRIAGAMVDPQPPRRCVVVKRVVAGSDGAQQVDFVTVCSR